ncbi:hypothetical protein BD309DRAFT_648619 [Dichomitus squalens]|uniref:Uncharacterized protein n=2 Tax=Dichomitus squalens TaxID=114155 RepID=A0A4Q9NCE9_9APHY|nr:uncharacterized protein DICSQDRAFT_154833 [Dichomitus squalens LYAD-421 SS1]EJF61976.1 hypothetical protein DICSQDRAFT_154833 [Dichomitus squalens LYAD-421 SS1]TBU37182.1 hypothetical protein BD309DRAFT_648619 [Dichomitus squalens]TBU51797.1 hypothetical protein BD310DRAFT_953091 [Dichomitus squalens]
MTTMFLMAWSTRLKYALVGLAECQEAVVEGTASPNELDAERYMGTDAGTLVAIADRSTLKLSFLRPPLRQFIHATRYPRPTHQEHVHHALFPRRSKRVAALLLAATSFLRCDE